MTHGYLLSGTGSNVYVQSLCRALTRAGHEVHLLCQDYSPLSHDFVNAIFTVNSRSIRLEGTQKIPYPGYCAVYRPEIGGVLPVYVYDDYPGWRVKTFLDLTDGEFEGYVENNAAAVRAVAQEVEPQAIITNHCLPGPLVARRALGGSIPHVNVVHGSALQYTARKSEGYMKAAREGLEDTARVVALSSHSAGTVAESFPELRDRTVALPGGVDTGLFRPEAPPPEPHELAGGPGRGPQQRRMLEELLDKPPRDSRDLAAALRSVAESYDPRTHDTDAGERIQQLMNSETPLLVYAGKLIHSKGVHSLLSAFAKVRDATGANLLVVGFGTFREALETLVLAISRGDEKTLGLLAASGQLFEGGPESPLEHFETREAEGLEEHVEFIGPLEHAGLARVVPAAQVAVVPSIFPETFGLVAAEAAACGVPPFVADHSGLSEAGGIVGQGLPFKLRVGMEGFVDNLAGALTGYLSLPEEERKEARRRVRQNCVEHLSWGALAEEVVNLVSPR